MNKADLINAISDAAGLTKIESAKAVEAFTATVTKALVEGDQLTLIGFGVFSVRDRAARIGRNPRTGEEIQIAAVKLPAFKAGKQLKEAVNR